VAIPGSCTTVQVPTTSITAISPGLLLLPEAAAAAAVDHACLSGKNENGKAQRRRIEVRNKTEVWLYVRKTPHGIDGKAGGQSTQKNKTRKGPRGVFGKHLENCEDSQCYFS
jgi:hypothetical protein